MISHAAPGTPMVTPAVDTVSEDCPDMSVGAYCRVIYLVSKGPSTSTFCYIGVAAGDEFECLPPHEMYCPHSACTFENTGQGAEDIPYLWQVSGNHATIIAVEGY
jgi:hypothetical protein